MRTFLWCLVVLLVTSVRFSGCCVPLEAAGNETSQAEVCNKSTNMTIDSNRTGEQEQNELREPRFRPIEYTLVGTSSMGIIFLIGVFGNVMVVLVVLQTRSMHTPTNCYLVSLSLADLMVLLSSIPNEIIAQYILEDEWIWGRLGCAVFIFTQYLGINASALSITAFTVERYIAICLPMKAQTMCTVQRAKKIIMCVWLFAWCYCTPWLFFLTTTEPIMYRGLESYKKETCTFSLARSFYMHFFFADFILFYVVPLIMSCVLYGLMARVLFKTDIASATKANGDTKSNANNSSRIQVVKMLIVVVVLFATLWLPYRVLLVYNSFVEKPYLELWCLMFCKTLIYVNSAVNPILYNAMSVKFRRAFRRTLSCGKHRGASCPASKNVGHRAGGQLQQENYSGAHHPAGGRSPGNRSLLSCSNSTANSGAIRLGTTSTLLASSIKISGGQASPATICRPVREIDLLQQML